jgi:DNA-binding MarR family transcriptional regulator
MSTHDISPKTPPASLPQLLTDARRWFEEALQHSLETSGAAAVSPTQVTLFGVLDEGGTTASELARRMGVTRQSAHQAVHGLVALGLLEQVPDPASARRRLIRRTELGRTTHTRAERILAQAESALAERIGADAVTALRDALERSWGEPPRIPPAAPERPRGR